MQLNKNQWGLGIKDIRVTNECLLLKWWWRYALEDEALWKTVICAKYDVLEGQWFPRVNDLDHVSVIWRDVIVIPITNPNLHIFQKEVIQPRI